MLGQHLPKDAHTPVDGPGEALLLGTDDLGDVGLLLPQVAILALIFVDHGVHDLIQERLVHAQELAVASGPAQQAAQHIAPALVGGEDTVANHERGRPDMVRDDPQGHIPFLALAIERPGELRNLVGNVHHRVHIKQRIHILAHHRQALQAHAGVDILLLQLRIIVVAVVIKLGKHIVPDLDIPVAIAAHGASGLTAAVFLTPVIVNLRAGAAGAGAVLPEVILLAEAEYPLLGDADLLIPDVKGLVIALIYRGIQPLLLQPYHLGQKLPAPGNGLVLEVVAKGEVAQHLEIGAVAGGMTHVVNVAGADALLAGTDPAPRGLLLPLEPGLHGGHAGVDKQDGLVVLGNQRKAGQAQMALTLKVAQEHFPQLVEAAIGMAHGQLLLLS